MSDTQYKQGERRLVLTELVWDSVWGDEPYCWVVPAEWQGDTLNKGHPAVRGVFPLSALPDLLKYEEDEVCKGSPKQCITHAEVKADTHVKIDGWPDGLVAWISDVTDCRPSEARTALNKLWGCEISAALPEEERVNIG